jgi:hypothetical protein
MKSIGLLLVLVLLGGGAYYFFIQPKTEEPQGKLPADDTVLGSYAYECTNDVSMRMEPSADMATVRVMISGAGFPSEAILTHVESFTGARYEGANMMFTGASEEVSIVSGNSSAICNPVPDSENAPFNWGDAGEGGGVVFDPVRVASEGIIGTWSLTEADVTTEFKTSGTLLEDRAGTKVEGTWTMSAPADAPIITMMFAGNPHGTSCEVATLTPERLLLRCTGEGEMFELSYTRAN